MKLETFFAKFEQFADAPGAVGRMRELILALAVRGRLVDTVHNDEPVETFLGRIWADKRGGRVGFTDAEKARPFELPDHWRWVVLAEVAEFMIGKTPPRGDSRCWYPGDHSWVSIADMKHYGTITETKEKVSALAAQEVFRQRFAEPGSILMSFKLTIGKVARAGIPCFHNEAIISILPPETELADYLFRFLPIFAALQTSNNAIKGSTLNKGLLTLLPIALPPPAEQKRIVAKVDELMALCDQLEAQQQEREARHTALARASLARFADAPTPANLQYLFHPSYTIAPADLRKTILTLAVQGKLVPQDPNDEPAGDWVRVAAPSKSGVASQLGAPSFLVPQGWMWLRVDSVFDVAGGIQKTPHRAPRRNAFAYLGVSNVYRGRLDLTDVKKFELGPGELERRRLEAGDLLIIEGNGSFNQIGRCAKWNGEIKNCVHQNHIIRCRPCDRKMSDFVMLFLNSDCGVEIMQKLAITSSGLYSLSVGKIRQIEIPIPPLAEQRRIVAKVDQLMALVDRLEEQLAASRATAANLLSALVAELSARSAHERHEPASLPTERAGEAINHAA